METSTALGDSDKYDRSIEFRMDWGNQSRSYGVGGPCRMDYNISVSKILVQNNANHGLETPSSLEVRGIFSDYRKYVLK